MVKPGFGGSAGTLAGADLRVPGSLAALGATPMALSGGINPKAKAATTGATGAGEAVSGGISRPTNVQRVVHVEWDAKTGQFKGLPSQWASAMGGGAEGTVDSTRLPEHVAPQAPQERKGLLDSILGGGSGGGGASGKGRAKAETDGGFSMVIGTPFNVQHNIHVQVDPSAPTGFKGLPPEWSAMLEASGISAAEVREHPQAVLDVLHFHMEGPPAPPPQPKLPKREALGE